MTNATSSTPLIVAEDYTTSSENFTYSPVFFTPEEYKQPEFVPKSLVTDLSSYLDYYQVPTGMDTDGDGLSTEMEFFTGTDLLRPEGGVIDFTYLIDEESSAWMSPLTPSPSTRKPIDYFWSFRQQGTMSSSGCRSPSNGITRFSASTSGGKHRSAALGGGQGPWYAGRTSCLIFRI